MKVAVLGGGPAGLYFAISMKLRDSAHEVTVVERNRADDTFGWGVVLSAETLDNLGAQRPGQRRLDQAALRLLGRHRRRPQGRAHGLDRARLLRHRPQAAADAAAAAGARTRRRPAVRDRVPIRGVYGNARPGGRRRRAELAGARGTSPKSSSPTSTRASASSSGSAPSRSSTTPSPSSSRRPSTAGCGRMPTSSTPTPRRSSSNAARRPGTRFGFGDDDAAGIDRRLRAHLRQASRRPQPDDQRQPHPRLGVDQFSARAVRALVVQEPRADGRRGGERAFLDRLGHQAGARKRRRAGRLRRIPSRTSAPPSQVRGCAPYRGAEAAVGGAQFARMVRGGRALSRPRPGAVQLFAADPLAAHQPREPAAARSRMAGRRRGLVPAPGRRRRPTAAPRADVRAVPAARACS